MRVIDWDDFESGRWLAAGDSPAAPLALTVGVFDGVHLGHRELIRCVLAENRCFATVFTFRRNPLETLAPDGFGGDIFGLERKLFLLRTLGVKLTVLIDFSAKFSMISGRDFIDLLLDRHPVGLIALGEDFRCGRGLDTGVPEIRNLAAERGIETRIVPPVMDGGRPVSSSRIRLALAAGRVAEAERLLGHRTQMEYPIGGDITWH